MKTPLDKAGSRRDSALEFRCGTAKIANLYDMRNIIILIVALAALCGCTRKIYVPVENTVMRTDTVYSATLRVDSVVFRDSVAMIQKGDTVFLTKYRDRYRVNVRMDTVYRYATDSVRIEVPYPVERELTRWEKTKMDAGGIAIGAGTALLVAVIALLIWLIKIKRRK